MKALFSWMLSCTLMPCFLYGQESPSDKLFEGLGSEEFIIREGAQAELLAWALKSPQFATPKILKLFQEDNDPEVRKRALEILKGLGNIDYLSDGQGYLGILMEEEPLDAAQGGQVRFGIRVLDVMKGSPAEQADLKIGDLIVSLDGKAWEAAGAVTMFRGAVAAKKPLAEVTLMVQRAQGDPIGITVKLGKRPIPDLWAGGDLGLLEQQAKELHFKQWLKKQQEE
jgi:hypothetical protein